MVNEEVLQEYSNSIRNLKQQCLNAGVSEDEFRKMYFDSLNTLQNNNRTQTQNSTRFSVKYKILSVGIIIVLCAAFYMKPVYSSVVCNLQEYIYPGLKVLRKIFIPLISLFPSLTELYHETCLIQNPFFTVVDMDCWPCSTVTNVREIYDPKLTSQQHRTPFIYETEQQVIKMEVLKDLYIRNRNIFDKESPNILVNKKYNIRLHDLFHEEKREDKNMYIWRFNTMNLARLIRQIIPRPKVVPKFGQSIERFIIIDSSQESFRIPDTECNYSFLISLSGSRIINLIPAEECKHQCKPLQVELKESYLLWYNWWYWRPVVLPSAGNNTLIAHVGSYC